MRRELLLLERRHINAKVVVLVTIELKFLHAFYVQTLFVYCSFQSLQYLDQPTASLVFTAALEHCNQQPVTFKDTEMISTVIDTFLARCLFLPEEPSLMVSELLTPLSQPPEFIWTVFPLDDNDVTMETSKNNNSCEDAGYVSRSVSIAGDGFFDKYVEASEFTSLLMRDIDERCNEIQELEGVNVEVNSKMEECMGKVGLLCYLHHCGSQDSCENSWLTFNLSGVKVNRLDNEKNADKKMMGNSYMINCRLAKHLAEHVPLNQVKQLSKRLIEVARKTKDLDENREICILPGVCVKYLVLDRMIFGSMIGQNSVEGVSDMSVCLGDNWSADVTLEALLWRIQLQLPQHQGNQLCLSVCDLYYIYRPQKVHSVFRHARPTGQVIISVPIDI